MYTCQLSLVNHIKNQFEYAGLQTVEIFAKELDEKGAVKTTKPLPAIFIMFTDGKRPKTNDPGYNFNVIVITSSKSLDPKTKERNNLQLASNLAEWLMERDIFFATGGAKSYQILPEIEIGVYALTDRHCVVVLGTSVVERREYN